MRVHGTEALSGQHITVQSDVSHLPLLTCAKCGKTFRYRGIQDSGAVSGKTYDPTTGEWITTGDEKVYCDECSRSFSGGPYSGMKVMDIK